MAQRTNRSVRTLLAAAAVFAVGPIGIAAAQSIEPTSQPLAADAPASERLERVSQIVDSRPVEARAELLDLMDGAGSALSDRERTRGFDLLLRANRTIQTLSPTELSLQKAELAVRTSDLVTAQQHASAVAGTPGLDRATQQRADRLVDLIAARQAQLRPMLDAKLASARDSYMAGDLASTRESLKWISRSGLALDDRQSMIVETLQMRVVSAQLGGDLETVNLGAVQPGVVRTQGEGSQPASQPADQPSDQPPAADEPTSDQPDLIADAARREALRELAAAQAAYNERLYGDALARFENLKRNYAGSLTTEEIVDIDESIADLRLLAGEEPQPGAGLDEVIRSREVVRQEARVEYDNLMAEAQRLLDTGDIDTARQRALEAKLKMQSVRDYFSPSEVEEYVNRAEQLVARVEAREEQLRIERENEEARRLAQQAQAREREAALDRQRRINEAILRVRDLQMNRQYEEALDVIEDQILFIDPNNPAGLLLQDIIRDTLIFSNYNRSLREQKFNIATLAEHNMEATIPPTTIIDFPPDWPAISVQRTMPSGLSDSAENRAVLAKMQQQRLPDVNFQNNTLEEAIGFLAGVTQLNIDTDWDALEAINISRDDTLTLSLRNVTIETVLNRVLERVSEADFGDIAAWAVQDGVLVISSDEQIRKNTVLDIYDVRDLVVEVPDYTEAPTFDLNSILQSGQGGGGQSPFQDQGNDDSFTNREPLQDRIDRMKDIIREQVDFDGWRANGGDTGFIQDWNGQLIITNTPANHREIRGLLSKLRAVRAMQINVETRFLLVSQDFFEQIGFDFDIIFNADSNQVQVARGTDPNILPGDFFDSTGRFTRTVNSPGAAAQTTVPPSEFSPIGVLGDTLGLAGALIPNTGIASQVLGGAPALGVSGQFLDDVQVDFLVQATQADRRTVELTAPRLTFTNGQTSNVYVATQVGFVSDLQPIVSDSAVGFDPTIDVISEGVRLVVEGTISADRRFVTMNVDAAIAQIEGFESQPVTAVAGGELVQSADTQSFIQVPTTTVTRVQTTVTVPDQGTVLLGGQRLVTDYEVEAGVPVLSKIPVINRFFTNRITSRDEQTLLILLKPTILIQSEQEERAFPGLIDSLGAGLGG